MMSASRLTQASRLWSRGFSLWGPGFAEGRAPHARNIGIATYRCISPLKPLVPLVRVLVSRRGGLRTPAGKVLAPPGHIPARPPGVRLCIGCEWNASAWARPRNADAQSASLRQHRLSRHLRVFPGGHPCRVSPCPGAICPRRSRSGFECFAARGSKWGFPQLKGMGPKWASRKSP
jgi:hypothetical protein